MKDNIRECQTLKFFRGKKRNNVEMQRLAEARLDFEYRRLLIEENELDLHVAFSKMLGWKWLAFFQLLFLKIRKKPFVRICSHTKGIFNFTY